MNKRRLLFIFLLSCFFLTGVVSGTQAPQVNTVHLLNTVDDRVISDTDNDQLSNRAEVYFGTDPNDSDSDNDGFNDGIEVNPDTAIGEQANPLQKDIFIDITRVRGSEKISQESIAKINNTFKTAPVTNEYSTNGINVHIKQTTTSSDEITEKESLSYNEYSWAYYDESVNEFRNKGFYHVLLVENATLEGEQNIIGVTNPSSLTKQSRLSPSFDGMLVERNPSEGSTIIHELGHQFGLQTSVYEGVDSYEKSWSKYPSVMNYNEKEVCTIQILNYDCHEKAGDTFSEQKGFNDWEYIENNFTKTQATYEQNINTKQVPYTVRDILIDSQY